MNKTANFQLTQWEKTDRIHDGGLQSATTPPIDAALKANADERGGAANGAGQGRETAP